MVRAQKPGVSKPQRHPPGFTQTAPAPMAATQAASVLHVMQILLSLASSTQTELPLAERAQRPGSALEPQR